MSASLIYDLAPIGSLVAWADGTPRPPERHSKKLSAWKTRNGKGRLIRKEGSRTTGSYTAPASFTLHEGDIGGRNTILITILRTFSIDSALSFTVVERPPIGSVRVFDRPDPAHELVHLAESRAAAEIWLKAHRHPLAVMDEVTADGDCCRSDRREGCRMTVPVPSNATHAPNASTPEDSGVEYGRSDDGLLIARNGDLVFAMVPGPKGFFLASAWRIRKPFADMKRDDFYSHHGAVEDETAFRTRMTEQAGHSRELKLLDRKTLRIPAQTPWGASQYAETYADGIVRHGTSRHGGFHLSFDCNAKVDPCLRKSDGWYEEDCEWAIVALTFPDLFTGYEQKCADRAMRDWWPSEWENIHGRKLEPGESHLKDQQAFKRNHADHWVAISALRSEHRPGMTEVIATRGGRRDLHVEEQRFLVPSAEYQPGRFGFVIDETRHTAYDGPSSFATWQGRQTS